MDNKRKKTKKTRAVVEILFWMLCFVAITYSVYVFSELGFLPTGLAIVIPSCIGWVGGVRVGGLINLI